MATPEDIITDLRRRRTAAGLSQQALADKAGMGRQAVSKLEGGFVQSTLHTVAKVAEALGVDLRLGDGEPSPTSNRAHVLGYVLQLEQQHARLEAEVTRLRGTPNDELIDLRIRHAELERELASARRAAQPTLERAKAAEDRVQHAEQGRRRAERALAELRSNGTPTVPATSATPATPRQASLRAELNRARSEVRRAREALDALARMPVVTHDHVDRARRAVAGRNPNAAPRLQAEPTEPAEGTA